MGFVVTLCSSERIEVEADEHRLEGRCHVFRRTVLVMGRPRTTVALRLPATSVAAVVRG